MSDNREVKYGFSEDELETLMEGTSRDEVYRALGYLTTWGLHFPSVRVFIFERELEMVGVYYDEDGQSKYTIGAVWHDDHFGFHS